MTTKVINKKDQIAIKSMVEKEAAQYLKGAKLSIQNKLEQATLSLLGLEKNNWGGQTYEIDHCNGRNSVLIDAFRSIAIEEAKNIARTYKPTKKDIVAWQSAFAKEYRDKMYYAIRELAAKKAKEDADAYMVQVDINIAKLLSK